MRAPGQVRLTFAVLFFLAAGGCGYGGGSGSDSGGEGGPRAGCGLPSVAPIPDGDSLEIAGVEASFHGTCAVGTSIEVTQRDFFFEPTLLIGDAGQSLEVHVVNEGGSPHTFTVEGQGVDVVLDPGDDGEATVTFPDSGALAFVCRFHASSGMRGGLSVGADLEPAAGSERDPDDSGGGGYGYP